MPHTFRISFSIKLNLILTSHALSLCIIPITHILLIFFWSAVKGNLQQQQIHWPCNYMAYSILSKTGNYFLQKSNLFFKFCSFSKTLTHILFFVIKISLFVQPIMTIFGRRGKVTNFHCWQVCGRWFGHSFCDCFPNTFSEDQFFEW